MKNLSLLLAGMLISGTAGAQPALRLKGLNSYNSPLTSAAGPLKTLTPGQSHMVLQFAHNPSDVELAKLADLGVTVLSYIPDYAFSVSIPDVARLDGLDIHWQGRLQPEEKISAEFGISRAAHTASTITAVAEFYPDVDRNDAREIVTDSGLRVLENADMLPNHLLVRGDREQLIALATWDEVSYIFPASRELTDGMPVHACAGAMTSQGAVEQAIPVVGDGWDGPGLGTAALSYAFDDMTAQLPADSVQTQLARAFSQWSNAVQVTFTPASDPNGDQTIGILFATGAHGDGYPFIGTSVLAHTFYPFPVNPEPIAGDMHFNDAQTWRIGSRVDLYSVALHEAGHSLGLGHSDVPGDVMYPYYRMHTVLMPNDIAAARELYAATVTTSSPSPAPAPAPDPSPTPAPSSPLLLAVIAPPSTSPATPISISGTVSGGTGSVQVYWNATSGAFGTAQGSSNWTIPTIPLIAGSNTITITAEDSLMNVVPYAVAVSYQPASPTPAPAPPSPNPPTPTPTPSGPDTTPPSLTILSPATTNYYTSASALMVSGTATDNVGVASVTWATSNGTSGIATGTTNWSTSAIPLYIGSTTIVITASDAAGNSSWRSLTVTRD
jgi:Matrixin